MAKETLDLERGSTFTFTRGFSYITSILIYARKASSSLRPYAPKNYATVEIHLKALGLLADIPGKEKYQTNTHAVHGRPTLKRRLFNLTKKLHSTAARIILNH